MTPEPSQAEKIKSFFERVLDRVSPQPAPAPARVSTMRLTHNELIVIQLALDLRLMWGVDLDVVLELTDWYLMGDEYPFREENQDFISLGLKAVNAEIAPKKKPETKNEGTGIERREI